VFVVIGALGTSDVEDNLLYRILVVFRTASANPLDTDSSSIFSTPVCITKIVYERNTDFTSSTHSVILAQF